ncbi:hypothetical protein HPB47_011104 [Ixodes persulcatus]|uniref:Uncharacterized protein n=1 Tax=Ixodes persulcatus TaxID=34615 RepID=A0AC60NXI1_IXOPE|nr:hypothetical protein HPB47_011104 [Ixodes persulcatus]
MGVTGAYKFSGCGDRDHQPASRSDRLATSPSRLEPDNGPKADNPGQRLRRHPHSSGSSFVRERAERCHYMPPGETKKSRNGGMMAFIADGEVGDEK